MASGPGGKGGSRGKLDPTFAPTLAMSPAKRSVRDLTPQALEDLHARAMDNALYRRILRVRSLVSADSENIYTRDVPDYFGMREVRSINRRAKAAPPRSAAAPSQKAPAESDSKGTSGSDPTLGGLLDNEVRK